MNKKPITFFTTASDLFHPLAIKMVNSFKKFHKDIPIHIFGQKEMNEASKLGYETGYLYGYAGSVLAKEYELVIQIDADSIVCDKLDEVLENDYDVAVVRNNRGNKIGMKLIDVPRDKYYNAGFVASRSERFWNLWRDTSLKYYKNHFFVENSVLNNLLAYSDFNIKVLDHEKSGLFYGCSMRGHAGEKSLWKDIRMVNGKMECEGRRVKILHWAGGGNMKSKLQYRKAGFDSKVCDYLDMLVK